MAIGDGQPNIDPNKPGAVPFRLAVLNRLERELARIRINLDGDETLGRSRIHRGRSIISKDELADEDGTVNHDIALSILESYDVQWVRGGLALIATAGENLSSRFFDAIDLGPKDGAEGATEFHLVIQGWVDDTVQNPTDPLYPFLACVQQALSRVRKGYWHPEDGSIPFDDFQKGPGILGMGEKAPMIDSLEFGRGVIRPADEMCSTAGFTLRLVLTLVEDFDNPFVEG